MSLAPPPHGLPPAYGGCNCSCHRLPGIMHLAPCCRPSALNMPTDPEWYRKMAELEGDSDISAGAPDKPVTNMVLVLVPREPTPELIDSMIMRFDHGAFAPAGQEVLGMPVGPQTDEERLARIEMLRTQMRQLHEEVVGDGFYRPARPSLEGEVGGVDVAQLRYLISEYFDLGHAEGAEGRDMDTEDGAAQETWAAIQEQLAAVLSLSADNARLREERDALLAALGFKPGHMGSAREVILKDAAGLRPEMVRARTAERELRSDRDWDRMAAAELLRKWVKGKFGSWITWRTAWAAVDEIRPDTAALSKGEQNG